MGQSIVVNEKPSSNPGVIRFETNRALTGMDHERYLAGQEIWGERPPDELARRLLDKPSVAGVQINGNMVTVDLNKGFDSEGLLEVIENLYRFYPDAAEAGAGATTEADGAPAPASEGAPAAPAEPAVDEPAAEAADTEPAVDEPAAEAADTEPAAASQAAAEEPSPADAPPTEPVAADEPEDATAATGATTDEPEAPAPEAGGTEA